MTMRLVGRLAQSGRDFKGAYRCDACGAVSIDPGLDSYDDEDFRRKAVPAMACPLCGGRAPLSGRYRTALCTLAWACRGRLGGHNKGADIGFPSFESVFVTDPDLHFISVDFMHKGVLVTAEYHTIGLSLIGLEGQERALDLDLDGGRELYGPRTLARRAVGLVRRDLRGAAHAGQHRSNEGGSE